MAGKKFNKVIPVSSERTGTLTEDSVGAFTVEVIVTVLADGLTETSNKICALVFAEKNATQIPTSTKYFIVG